MSGTPIPAGGSRRRKSCPFAFKATLAASRSSSVMPSHGLAVTMAVACAKSISSGYSSRKLLEVRDAVSFLPRIDPADDECKLRVGQVAPSQLVAVTDAERGGDLLGGGMISPEHGRIAQRDLSGGHHVPRGQEPGPRRLPPPSPLAGVWRPPPSTARLQAPACQALSHGNRSRSALAYRCFRIIDFTGASRLFDQWDRPPGPPPEPPQGPLTAALRGHVLHADTGEYLTNPPFGGVEGRHIQQNFPIQVQATELLFVQHIMRKLKPRDGARCGMVVPEGTLFRGGAFADVKRDLLEQFALHTIVSLPPGTFAPYSDVKTALLFFERPGPT